MHRCLSALACCLLLASAAQGAPEETAPGPKGAILRLEAGGPTAPVTGLAFSPDGKTLYVAGWDKVVRVYALKGKKFELDTRAFRVPVGPGMGGTLNILALSDDGAWLAVAGSGASSRGPGFRQGGVWAPALASEALHKDRGTIYVFNTRTRAVRLLRGHQGHVEALAFAPTRKGAPPLLCSVAREQEPGRFTKVARVWELGKEITSRVWWAGLPGNPGRVGLTVWYGGKEGKEPWAALSLGDKKFRAARLTPGSRRVPVQELVGTVTAAAVPDEARCLTACYGNGKARLRLWEFSTGAPVSPLPPVPRVVDSFPKALAVLSGKGDGKADLAAVALLRTGRGKGEIRLQLLDLDPESRGQVRLDRLLWKNGGRDPILATALRGHHLAVAGNAAHEVWVFALDERGRLGAAPQKIASALTPFRHVAFVRARGKKDLGLLLNTALRKRPGEAPPTPDKRQGDRVFDFKAGTLTDDPSGWETVVPATGGWRAKLASGDHSDGLILFQGGVRKRTIDLPRGTRIADHALLGRATHGTALLAIAANFYGQPQLMLYNAETGEQVRVFSGHSGPVSAVAFSPDGRFLVSAADDQTVRLWGLTDLNTILGAHARLPGVAVQMKDDDLTVAYVLPDSPAARRLSRGDVITAVGERKRFNAPHDFYQAFHELKPGNKVRLQVRGKGAVEVTAAQGVDERKPLFTLAVERDAPRDWIAWNPFGPYETSARRAERYLGWLFNTNKADEPTRFGTAEAHRNEFFRKGLVRESIETGKVIEKAALGPPTINPQVQVGEATRPNAFRTPEVRDRKDREDKQDREVIADRGKVDVRVYLGGRPRYTLDRVTWKVGDGKETLLSLDGPERMPLSFPLTLVPRKESRVTITAYTPEGPARDVSESFVIRYQPPPAVVIPSWKEGQVTTEDPEFTLRAQVRPGLPEEGVRVTIHHWHEGKDLLGKPRVIARGSAWPVALTEKVKLQRGENRFVIEAVNLGAPAGPATEREKGKAELVVYNTKKDPPPVFTFNGTIREASSDTDRSVLVTDLPSVRLTGRVVAPVGNLTTVEWGKVKKGRKQPEKWASPAKFEAGKAKELVLAEEVSLEPGRQVFQFRARARDSVMGIHEVVVDYRPRLPVVELDRPKKEMLSGEKETTTYRLVGKLIFPRDRQRFRAVLLVNGKEQGVWPPPAGGVAGALTIEGEKLKADISVRPGVNRIQVRLSNEWGAPSRHDEFRLRYGRPPRLLGKMELVGKGRDRPTVDVRARVWSPVPLQEPVEVKVNGQKAEVGKVVLKEKGDVTTVLLQDVLLQAGTKQDTIRLSVTNRETTSPASGDLLLPPKKEIFPRARLTIESVPTRVFDPEAKLVFTVSSTSRVSRVVLEWGPDPKGGNLRAGQRQKRTLPLPKAVKEDGLERRRFQVKVPLTARENLFLVRAENQGGVTPLELGKLTYLPPPIRLRVDRLIPGGLRAEAMPITRGPDGKFTIPRSSPDGRVEIEGTICWLNPAAKARSTPEDRAIRVYANGFQQSLAQVFPGQGGPEETPFRATVLLNREVNEVGLWSAKEDPDKRITLVLPCKKPNTHQRLHVLMLSPHKGSLPDTSVFKTPAFDQTYDDYAKLVGQDVTWRNLRRELDKVRSRILALAHTRPARNDVVMIYYHGGERLGIEGPQGIKGAAFEAQPGPPPRFNIHSGELADALADIPGAFILLFDVERKPADPGVERRDTIALWPEEYPRAGFHVSILRYAWTGKAAFPKKERLLVGFQKSIRKQAQLEELLRAMGALVADPGKDVGPLRSSKDSGPLHIFTYVPKGLVGLRVGR